MAPKRHTQGDPDSNVATQSKSKEKLERPRLYKVIFHNDNYTTMEFVVAVLKDVFRKSESDAITVMLQVHRNGWGVAGVYPYEVAETKLKLTEKLAQQNEFPLRLSLEPEEL